MDEKKKQEFYVLEHKGKYGDLFVEVYPDGFFNESIMPICIFYSQKDGSYLGEIHDFGGCGDCTIWGGDTNVSKTNGPIGLVSNGIIHNIVKHELIKKGDTKPIDCIDFLVENTVPVPLRPLRNMQR